METETYRIEWQGPMYPDYFQGAGVSGTRWDAVAVGSGGSIEDAYEDAVDFAYQREREPADLPKFSDTDLPSLEIDYEENPDSESLYFVIAHYMLKGEGA